MLRPAILRLLVRLLLSLLSVYIAPGICAVVVFLPSGARVLADVAVMPGIHATGGIAQCSMRKAVTLKELSKVSVTANFRVSSSDLSERVQTTSSLHWQF